MKSKVQILPFFSLTSSLPKVWVLSKTPDFPATGNVESLTFDFSTVRCILRRSQEYVGRPQINQPY